jgi:hypothetical protein
MARPEILRRVLPAVLIAASAGLLHAQDTAMPGPGSRIMLATETPLVSSGKTVRVAPAGAQFQVAATNAGQGQVFVSVTNAEGKTVMASLPLANVVVIDSPDASASPAPEPQAPAQSVSVSPAAPVPAAPPAPAPVTQAGPPQAAADGSYQAIDVARFFKADRAAATAHFSGKPLKVNGSIERAEMQVGSDSPIVILSTAQGLPKVKLNVHPSVSRDREFYRRASALSWYYDGWYHTGHKLEFRPASKGLEARFKYKRSYSSSSGSSATYKSWSDWFPLLTIGDVLTARGTCKGVLMDVIVESAELARPPM